MHAIGSHRPRAGQRSDQARERGHRHNRSDTERDDVGNRAGAGGERESGQHAEQVRCSSEAVQGSDAQGSVGVAMVGAVAAPVRMDVCVGVSIVLVRVDVDADNEKLGAKIRRAQLYYFRQLQGKSARLKERLVAKTPKVAAAPAATVAAPEAPAT